ncbi:TetR/AcrR family transcriptional regulator [Pseudonocardia sp. DSM 110487]|uniref:TetR/AcrR family transcriptional regulator n=1 Tax=Pseudonocardia sp. DSM 110487 TaxID=2865833 RepID=UPI001C69DBE3|nr:helix-turn-helix domain-containing protein [Pseudonocardia sp. DSM 110487]QYN34058.1 TetR/AcrR family transcriptional regulator [Pseudonocardia sp. DSM 110487]
MSADVRQQIVAGAADLIRRRGLAGTSIRGLAEHAAAPLGSTYHYFPGGKQQLAAEAVRFAGDQVAGTLRAALEAGPVDGLRAFLALWWKILTRTGFRAGCPVLVVSVEEPAGDESAPREAAAEAFRAWEGMLADSLREHGADARDAEELATLVVAAVEGAVAMCRARRDTGPLDRVAARLELLVSEVVSRPA